MPNIIFCADDFGLSNNISKSIIELAQLGKVGATSVMYNKNQENNIKTLSTIPNIKIGMHFFLTTLPLVLNDNIIIKKPLEIYQRLIIQNPTFILDEFLFQLNDLERTLGRKVDYIDSHHYIFTFPLISDIIFSYIESHLPDRLIKLPINKHPVNFKEKANTFLSKRIIKKYKNVKTFNNLIGVQDFNQNPLDVFHQEITHLESNESYHFSTHPCENPIDVKNLDPLVEFRTLDYNFLKNLDFKKYNLDFNK